MKGVPVAADDRKPIDIYARVSRLGDERQRPTEGQVLDCRTRLDELGHPIGEELVDPGRSAWNPRVKRKQWTTLMERLESGTSGGVIVFDLARFSRRPIEGERLIALAERGLLVLDSEGEYDLTTPSGKKAFRDQLNSAAYESDRTSARSKRGKRLKALKGEVSSAVRPFGFEPDAVTKREAEAEEIRASARRALDGETQDSIVLDWNKRRVLTSMGGQWTRETWKQMMLRPRNNGWIVHNGDAVGRMPGTPILDDETWADLVAMFAARRRGRPISDQYLCSGLVFCGREGCGYQLTGRPRGHLTPYPDGEIRRQYHCQKRVSHEHSGCGRLSVDQRQLDDHIRDLVIMILSDHRHAEAIEVAARATADRRQELEDEIERAEQLAEELAGRLGREEISLARFDAAIAPLDAKLARKRTELEQLGTPAPAISADEAALSAAQWRARWDAATVPEQRSLFRRALRGRKIYILPKPFGSPPMFDPNRIEIRDA
jgi:site-specific DNA recombinase